MNPLISVMIPVYNAEQYLARCLDSVLSQTYSNIEVILVNDGSIDTSGAICDRYAALDNRIKVFHKHNEGVAATRNFLLSKANGELLVFVDSDDTIPNDAVSAMHERMVHDGSDMVVGRYAEIDEDCITVKDCSTNVKDGLFTGIEILERLGSVGFEPRAPWAKLYKREVFNGLQYPPLIIGEDSFLYPRIVQRCNLISNMGQCVYFYHMIPQSLTHTRTEKSWCDAVYADVKVVEFLLRQGVVCSARCYFDCAVRSGLRMDNPKTALKMIKDSFSKEELQLLMRGRGLKPYIKWLCFYVPCLYKVIRWVKTRLGYD